MNRSIFTYNNMLRSLQVPSKKIAFFSDFRNWNEFEDNIINILIEKGNQFNLKPAIIIFQNKGINEGIWNKTNLELLAKRFGDKIQIIFYVVNNNFNDDLTTDIFVNDLKNNLGIEKIVVASNFQDPNYLIVNTKMFEKKWDDQTLLIDNFSTKENNSKIISYLNNSEFDLFFESTGLNYLISGKVIKGKQNGKTIGFPTANFLMSSNSALTHGVYAVKVMINDTVLDGMACFWINELNQNVMEVNIFDFDQDLYGQTIEIRPIQKLRNNKKINDVNELIKLLSNDKANTRELMLSTSIGEITNQEGS